MLSEEPIYFKIENPDDWGKKKHVACELKTNKHGEVTGRTKMFKIQGWTNQKYIVIRFFTKTGACCE